MKPVLAVALGMATAAFAGMPAEYTRLEIEYRADRGGHVVETRKGEIRFGEGSAPAVLRGFLAPKLNAAGRATVRYVEVIRANGRKDVIRAAQPEVSDSGLFWSVPNVRPGDGIRFAVEQDVDVTGQPPKAWWFQDPGRIELPAEELSVEVAAEGAVTVLDAAGHTESNGIHKWRHEHVRPGRAAPLFAIGSFGTKEARGAWLSRGCPVTRNEALVRIAEGTVDAEEMTLRLAQALNVWTDRTVGTSCRPLDQVLAGRSANPLEAQAALMGLFQAARIESERVLFAPAGDAKPNPEAFASAWIRVKTGEEWRWIDVARLAAGDPDLTSGRLFSLDRERWIDPPKTFAQSKIAAQLDLSLRANGTLQGRFTLTGSGPASRPYREAFQPGRGFGKLGPLFATFLETRKLRSSPVVSDPYDAQHPFELAIPIQEDGFALPIARRVSIQPAALATPMKADPAAGDRVWTGNPGVYSEEITVDAPDFRLNAEGRVEEDREFARYRSSAEVVDSKLRIRRELTIKRAFVNEAEKKGAQELNVIIQKDQLRGFILWRMKPAAIQDWVASVPPYQLDDSGLMALKDREFEAAVQLLERAVNVNEKDQFAWNNLGRAYVALGRNDEARRAYKKQIEVNPTDEYAYNNLGLVEMEEGWFAGARDLFRKQLEVHPGDPYATGNLPRVLTSMGAWEEAERAYAAAARMNPNGGFAVEYAASRVCAGSPDGIEELRKRLDESEDQKGMNDAAYQLAECGKNLADAERWALAAVRSVQRRLAANPGRLAEAFGLQSQLAANLDTLAWVYWKESLPERALPLLEAAAEIHESGEVLVHLAETQWKLGRRDAALENWRTALERTPGLATRVPAGVETQVRAKTPKGHWTEVGKIPIEANGYCVVFAKPDGQAQQIRCPDMPSGVAEEVGKALQALSYPHIILPGDRVPTVHVVKVEHLASGETVASRSISNEAMRILSGIVPEEFETSSPRAIN